MRRTPRKLVTGLIAGPVLAGGLAFAEPSQSPKPDPIAPPSVTSDASVGDPKLLEGARARDAGRQPDAGKRPEVAKPALSPFWAHKPAGGGNPYPSDR